MGTVWKPQPSEIYQFWIEAIENEASDRLSDWELNFIASITERLKYGPLTEAQVDKLESIYTKYTS